jgi:sugar phosphate isomerase/epimerase
MRLAAWDGAHLTYCTNIHPGEGWDDVRAALAHHVVAVKARVALEVPFGVGLRLSARAADELATRPGALDELRDWLRGAGLYVFTLNGFPYGTFHGSPVKDQVYRPDWTHPERLRYTARLARVLAALLPDDVAGSVSTVPGAMKRHVADDPTAIERIADGLLTAAADAYTLARETGRTIALCVEPEPGCVLETTSDAADFFTRYLFARHAVARFAGLTGASPGDAEAALHRHLTVCLDACHAAIEFERASEALATLRAAGVAVGKYQLTTALECRFERLDGTLRAALGRFADDVYLHQVVERDDATGALARYADLPDALAAAEGAAPRPRTWRVHFHVPVFATELGRFGNTQAFLRELLAAARGGTPGAHLEVETYTWDVLPAEHRTTTVDAAIARELAWVRAEVGA